MTDIKNLQPTDVFIGDRTPLLLHIVELQKVIDEYEARVERLREFEQISKPLNPSMEGDDHKLGRWRGLAEALAIMTEEG